MAYLELESKIQRLGYWDGIEVFEIGKSTLNQPIYCVHVGDFNGKQIMIDAAIHAREYISSYLLLELIKHTKQKDFCGGFYFIPVCNPDGVRLAMEGSGWIQDPKHREILNIINDDSTNFSLWKANAMGVDLNVNFDADWGGGKQNVFTFAPANFVGHFPNSEKETKVLINFLQKTRLDAFLSYHSKGEVIYYGFEGLTEKQLLRDLVLSQKISDITGYEVIRTKDSTGGTTDWVSRNLGIPALTIEIGNDTLKHPISLKNLRSIFTQNSEVPFIALDFVNQYKV